MARTKLVARRGSTLQRTRLACMGEPDIPPRPKALPVPAAFQGGALPAGSEVAAVDAAEGGEKVAVVLRCYGATLSTGARDKQTTYVTTFRCAGAPREHLRAGGYLHSFLSTDKGENDVEDWQQDEERGEGPEGVASDCDGHDADERFAQAHLWCHAVGGGSTGGSPPFKAVLRSDRRVIAYIRGCFYLEVERWTPTVPAEPQRTQAGRGHPALAEQKQPRALAELGVRRDYIADQLKSLILTAQALEATADAAEARYKEVVAVNAKLATTSDQLRYSLHQANVRIRNLERALQAKDEELEQARRGGAVRAPDPAAYARVYDLRGRPMFLPRRRQP